MSLMVFEIKNHVFKSTSVEVKAENHSKAGDIAGE